MNYATIKKLLVLIGFHHSWGYWISNKDKALRVMVYNSVRKNAQGFRNTNIQITTQYMVYGERINVTNIKTTEELSALITANKKTIQI